MDFYVGTFNLPLIYTLRFDPARRSLEVINKSTAVGAHSWLALSRDRRNLYATAWTDPPSVAAYALLPPAPSTPKPVPPQPPTPTLLNTLPVASLSGYVAVSPTHLYSAGGPSGEVFSLDQSTGSLASLVQRLDFLADEDNDDTSTSGDRHGAFGGLRHGAHSADLSPDGRRLYVADIGRNCVWVFDVTEPPVAGARGVEAGPYLVRKAKVVSKRVGDGARHAWPHPNGRMLYVVQEHSSIVDAYAVDADDATALTWRGAVRILPDGEEAGAYWADEVRLSTAGEHGDGAPRWLFASTRGLDAGTRGWVVAVELDAGGGFVGGEGDVACRWRTGTSGGIANAIEPAPAGWRVLIEKTEEDRWVDWLALTDSEEGWVSVLGWDGRVVEEVARVRLVEEGCAVVKAATAVWL